MKRRVFVAIPASEELQEEAARWREEWLKRQPGFAASSASTMRWLAGKNLHLTLIPPWYEERAEEVAAALRRLPPRRSFALEFRCLSFGPNPRRPRLLWAEGSAPPDIANLKAELEALLKKPGEQRPFLLHLTLARLREEHFASLPRLRSSERISWNDTAKSIVLMESHLSPAGADYEVLEEIPFERGTNPKTVVE